MNDQASGVLCSTPGKGSVIAAQMAVGDFGGKVRGILRRSSCSRSSKQTRSRSVARAPRLSDVWIASLLSSGIANTGVPPGGGRRS